ncbi:hypothetical protein GCM10027425_18650 [Alteromonas gracilis]
MLADEGAAAAQRLEVAVDHDGVVGQLPGGLGGDREHGAQAALDVDGRVAAGRTGAGGEGVELLGVGHDLLGHRLEDRGALVEGHRAQGRAADLAGIGDHRRHVEPGRGQSGHLLAGDRVEQRGALVVGGEPRAAGVAGEEIGHEGAFRCVRGERVSQYY